MVDGWMGTLDTLFIFAGLFSAVVATFLSLTAQTLQQDYSAVTASLLTEMVSLQRATATGGNISAVPQSDLTYNSAFTSSSRDIWLNSLWFASLVLTLSVALMTGLIKQWLHYYLADITGTTPKVRAWTRQFRYRGIINWGVPPIIESLPVLMNTSLFLFFIGLVLFTRDLSGTIGISWFLVGVTAILFTIYIGSSLIPVWKPQCPYKTSLSRVYNGLVKVVWYFVRKLSFKDEEQGSSASSSAKDTRSCFKHYYNQFKRRLAKVLRHGSSLGTAESETVGNLSIRLTQDIIIDMGINSTNPSVSAIALQSLAALHASQAHKVSDWPPNSLIKKLQGHFHSCFQYTRSELNPRQDYSVTSESSVAERYSRAMLLFPEDHISHLGVSYWGGDCHRMLSLSPLGSLGTAILFASAVKHAKHGLCASYEQMEKHLKSAIQFILNAPSIEVSKLIAWQHHQFIEAIELTQPDLYCIDEREQLLVTLVKKLDYQRGALTLQEDLLIRCLYSCRTKEGVTELPKEQALAKELNLETPADATTRSREVLLRFVALLADIYDCALSLGSEEQDNLTFYLFLMCCREWTDGIFLYWNRNTEYRFNFEPELSFCVNSLIKLLNRLASSWERWNGDVILRLTVIIRFHNNILRFRGKCNEEVNHSMFHWLLVISLKGRDCPEEVNRYLHSFMDNLLHSVFPLSKDYTITPLRTFCDFISPKRLVGLSPRIMEHLTFVFEHLLEEPSNEPAVLDCLDILFRHFIDQDPLHVDPVYPVMQVDQIRTLTSLINLAQGQQLHLTHSKELLSNWRVLVNDKLFWDSMDGGLDPWDLRDTLWIFEEDVYTDPWDLQDVLWMLEGQIPFGGPLNLHRLLRKLDKALNLQGSSIDLHDVTWLFQDAPDDLYPPPDNPKPET